MVYEKIFTFTQKSENHFEQKRQSMKKLKSDLSLTFWNLEIIKYFM